MKCLFKLLLFLSGMRSSSKPRTVNTSMQALRLSVYKFLEEHKNGLLVLHPFFCGCRYCQCEADKFQFQSKPLPPTVCSPDDAEGDTANAETAAFNQKPVTDASAEEDLFLRFALRNGLIESSEQSLLIILEAYRNSLHQQDPTLADSLIASLQGFLNQYRRATPRYERRIVDHRSTCKNNELAYLLHCPALLEQIRGKN